MYLFRSRPFGVQSQEMAEERNMDIGVTERLFRCKKNDRSTLIETSFPSLFGLFAV